MQLPPDVAGYDFCFIDGDHGYAGVRRDYVAFSPACKYMMFHDMCAYHASPAPLVRQCMLCGIGTPMRFAIPLGAPRAAPLRVRVATFALPYGGSTHDALLTRSH